MEGQGKAKSSSLLKPFGPLQTSGRLYVTPVYVRGILWDHLKWCFPLLCWKSSFYFRLHITALIWCNSMQLLPWLCYASCFCHKGFPKAVSFSSFQTNFSSAGSPSIHWNWMGMYMEGGLFGFTLFNKEDSHSNLGSAMISLLSLSMCLIVVLVNLNSVVSWDELVLCKVIALTDLNCHLSLVILKTSSWRMHFGRLLLILLWIWICSCKLMWPSTFITLNNWNHWYNIGKSQASYACVGVFNNWCHGFKMILLCDSIIDFSSVQGYYGLHSFMGFIQLSLFWGLSSALLISPLIITMAGQSWHMAYSLGNMLLHLKR